MWREGDHSYNVGEGAIFIMWGRTIVIMWGEGDHSYNVGGGGP